MKILGMIVGVAMLAVVFVIWLRAYRSIKGEDSAGPWVGKRRRESRSDSLEEFIAAYRRGEIPANNTPANAAANAALAARVAAQTPAPPRRDPFLSGPVKLTYYICKSGLRDHHVFAHIQLGALSVNGTSDPGLVHAGIDLLICNADMSVVAAIDVTDASAGAIDTAKSDYLKSLGIRYLRLTPKSLPRPEAIRSLLYRM